MKMRMTNQTFFFMLLIGKLGQNAGEHHLLDSLVILKNAKGVCNIYSHVTVPRVFAFSHIHDEYHLQSMLGSQFGVSINKIVFPHIPKT